MIFKKLTWAIKRHPFLYLTRFKLLSKNSNIIDITNYNYNTVNHKNEIPSFFFNINKRIFDDNKDLTDFEAVQKLSIWLDEHIKGGPGLSEPSEKALRLMLDSKGGVCSDVVQVFNNFCVINDILVREWGTTRAPFNIKYGGHSFNEVFCRELNKWILIDVSTCTLCYSEDGELLSVIDFYKFMRTNKRVNFITFNKIKPIDNKTIELNYLNPDAIPFLVCNYSNKTYDKFLKYLRALMPVFIIHFLVYSIGKSYFYLFPLDDYKKIFS